jgi:aspartate racemase
MNGKRSLNQKICAGDQTMTKKRCDKTILGILGGMGSEATQILLQLIFSNTAVKKDQDHLDILVYNHASLPDRTTCILNDRSDELLALLRQDMEMLKRMGCAYFAIPCNTCHYFTDEFKRLTDDRFIDMIEQTAKALQQKGLRKVGILATDGTRKAGLYTKQLEKYQIEALYPSDQGQRSVMDIIYSQIKQGQSGSTAQFQAIIEELEAMGCEAYVLACTELSVYKYKQAPYDDSLIDALSILAKACIMKCGGTLL